MTHVITIADLHNRMRTQVSAHPLETDTPVQVAGKLEALGYSTKTARNLAEIACAVSLALREGRMVAPIWGE